MRGDYRSMKNVQQYGLIIALVVAAVVLVQADRSREPEFVRNVRSMLGDAYSEENCSRFVCLAHGLNDYPCTAMDIWNGCGGRLKVVQQVRAEKLAYLDVPAGAVVAFHGAHVAVSLGNHTFADSTPERGVSTFRWEDVRKDDLWYSGPVRIMVWK